MSASLAFYSLLSLAPLITVAMSLASWSLGAKSVSWVFKSKIQNLFGESVAQVVDSILTTDFTPVDSVFSALFGSVVLLFGAVGVAGELRSSLNLIWNASSAEREESVFEMAIKRGRDLLLVLALCAVVLAISILSVITAAAGKFVSVLLPAPEWILTIGNFSASLLVLFVLFFLIHRYVPDASVTRRQGLVAALTTALLFAVGKEAVAIYIGKSTVGTIFGPGRTVVILLLWSYFSSIVLFLGAEFGHAWALAEWDAHKLPGQRT